MANANQQVIDSIDLLIANLTAMHLISFKKFLKLPFNTVFEVYGEIKHFTDGHFEHDAIYYDDSKEFKILDQPTSQYNHECVLADVYIEKYNFDFLVWYVKAYANINNQMRALDLSNGYDIVEFIKIPVISMETQLDIMKQFNSLKKLRKSIKV
jgi:hypothetical protein